MTFAQLEYFLKIAETLNFTEAAKALYISQPALSKQISLLEEEIDTKLFIRTSRKVVLTTAGIQFREDVEKIFADLGNAKQRAFEIGKNENKTLKIGCFDGKISKDFLPIIYDKINRINPDIKISLSMGGFEENRLALERDEIDIMLTLSKDSLFDSENYETYKIMKRTGVFVFSPILFAQNDKHTLTLGDFKEIPLLLVKKQEAPSMYEHTLQDLKALGIEEPKIIEAKNSQTMFTYLELGYGYTILGDIVAKENKSLSYFELPRNMETWVVAVWKKNHPFLDMLMDDEKEQNNK